MSVANGCRKRRGTPFRKGFDPRRHALTTEERRRGGLTTARRYLCTGRWHADWYDRCSRKTRNEKGDFIDGQEENADCGGAADGIPAGDDIPY